MVCTRRKQPSAEPTRCERADIHRNIMERQSSAEETDADICKLTFAHSIAAVLKSRLCFSSVFHVFSSFCKLGTALLLSASKRCTVWKSLWPYRVTWHRDAYSNKSRSRSWQGRNAHALAAAPRSFASAAGALSSRPAPSRVPMAALHAAIHKLMLLSETSPKRW